MTGTLVLEPGALFGGDFRVLRRLAEGGMGALYEVEQVSTGRRRALKVLLPQLVADPRQRERFAMEARVGARIESEHVVEVTAAGVDAATQTPWLVMEMLDGEDLATLLRRRVTMPRDELATVFDQLGDALGKAHAAGVVHRDLKPENVFVTRSGVRGLPFVVKVVDFGIATRVAEHASSAAVTSAIGSPMYMAPEQATVGARVQPSTDVWALGLIAFEALTGYSYWRSARGSDAEFNLSQLLVEVMVTPLEPASVRAGDRAGLLPAGFDAWFGRCVVRDPTARFGDARACVEALTPMLRGVAGPSAAPTRPIDAPPRVSLDEAYAPTEVATPRFTAPGPMPATQTAPPYAPPMVAPTQIAQPAYAQPTYAQGAYAQPAYAQPTYAQPPMPLPYAPSNDASRGGRGGFALWAGAVVGVLVLTCALGSVFVALRAYRARDRGPVTEAPSVAPIAAPSVASTAPSVAPRPACDFDGVPYPPMVLERDIIAATEPRTDALLACMSHARDHGDPAHRTAYLEWIVDQGRLRCARVTNLDEAPEVGACMTEALRGVAFPNVTGRPFALRRGFGIPFGERCDFSGLRRAPSTYTIDLPTPGSWSERLHACALEAVQRNERPPSSLFGDWSMLPGRGVGCVQVRGQSLSPALADCVVRVVHATRMRGTSRPMVVRDQWMAMH